jgi:transposase
MMGRRQDGQGQFFYSFVLDEVVPPDHLVRQIDAVLDLGWVHKELAPYYSHTGRPSIDPVLMIRMLIVGYVFALRSERRLCSEVQVNLAYRWFCKLGIEDKIPNHSVFCRARHERFRESDALRRVFEGVVAMCIAAGLVGGEAFSVDACVYRKLDSAIAVMKAAKDRLRGNGAAALDLTMNWGVLLQRSMCPRLIIICGVCAEDPAQMRLTEQDHVVEAFPPD